MQKIEGGYILLARKMLDSDLMDRPPLWTKLFIWMLLKANKKNGYKGLKIGEFYTTIREMREAMTHYVGYRKQAPTIKQIRVIYEGLSGGKAGGKAKGMEKIINTEPLKGKRGLKITILNYSNYQNPKNYEGHKKQHSKKAGEGQSEEFTKDVCRAYLFSKQEEYKNNKKIYKYISSSMIDFVVDFIFYIQEQKGSRAPSLNKSHIESSFDTVLSLVRLDGFDFEYIHKIVQWAADNSFWKENLLSLATLRTKSKTNGFKRFQNIANSYESEKSTGGKNGKSQNFTGKDTRRSVLEERMPEY